MQSRAQPGLQTMANDPVIKPGFPPGHSLHNHSYDPKLVDDTGQRVVDKKPWSQCATDLWLTVGTTKDAPPGRPKDVTGASFPLGTSLWLSVFGSRGPMTIDRPFWGTAIEIPSDLGDDPLKQTYLTEWFVETVREAVLLSGGNPFTLASSRQEMVDAVEAALRGQNL